MIVIIGGKKAFLVSISDHFKATKYTVGWNKIIREVFLDIFCTFKPVYSTQCPRKSSKGWWNQEIDEKIDFFQRQFSTILGLKMSCLQNKNYLNAKIRCIWHIRDSFVSKCSMKKVKMLLKSAKIDEKKKFFQRQFSIILRLKMTFLQNKNYLNAKIRCIWHMWDSFVFKFWMKKVKMLVKSAKFDEKIRKKFEKKNYFIDFSTGSGPFMA